MSNDFTLFVWGGRPRPALAFSWRTLVAHASACSGELQFAVFFVTELRPSASAFPILTRDPIANRFNSYTEPIPNSTALAGDRKREIFPMLAALGLLSWQLLLPNFIGLANNGDFLKVAGRQSLKGVDDGALNFLYFEPDYLRDPRFYWDSGLPSSENMFAWMASEIEKRVSDPHRFDIRWLGAVHMVVWLAGYFLLLRTLRFLHGTSWWIAAVTGLWIFMDVSYASQFNTFYTDVAAMLGAMTAVCAASLVFARGRGARPGMVVIFGTAILVYATSKGQHAVVALIAVAPLVAAGWIAARKSTRIVAFTMAITLIFGSVWTMAATPDWYRSQSRFNLLFFRILPGSATPASDARELGLAPSDLQYVGMHSFQPQSPAANPEWSRGFQQRGSYANVLRFYLRHPAVPLGFLWSDLRDQASHIRAANLSNFRQEVGKPPGAQSRRMATWSDFCTWWLVHAPSTMAIWYASLLIGGPWLAMRRRQAGEAALAWVIAFAGLMGLAEFCLASLTDCLETYRHLWLFHVFTDLTIFFAIILGLRVVQIRPSAGSTAAPGHS
jgi:hypothetical protein